MFEYSMTKNEIIETITNLRNGTMARITYLTELPMKAAFCKDGYKILKVTETTARFGVKYSNIKSVKEKHTDPSYKPSEKTNNFKWLVENKISHNDKTGKDYVRFVPMKYGSNKHSKYIFVDSLGKYFSFDDNKLPDSFKEMVQNSYWNTKHEMPDVQTICLENVLVVKTKSSKK